jgi:hypothetical protein
MRVILAIEYGKVLDEVVEHLLLCWRHLFAVPTTTGGETRSTEKSRNIVLDRFEVGVSRCLVVGSGLRGLARGYRAVRCAGLRSAAGNMRLSGGGAGGTTGLQDDSPGRGERPIEILAEDVLDCLYVFWLLAAGDV